MNFNEAESNASLDGHTVIKTATGITHCPTGVYIHHSQYASQTLSIALAAFMANKKVSFQVWDESARFWKGSGTPYCQVRAIAVGD